ncbi:DUF2155 domain-containing protein [Tranquillimonas alkanivorans]|uniref:DUF2155 domain-containing protein n=1 Tax=Tranquillimonas alkanivorans TaxID=441119 RepID=A0A1I5SNQ7_9RHOB|nr:hypothetical protein SAMN04488047_111117 [Tranquillimonas alkanivorans]
MRALFAAAVLALAALPLQAQIIFEEPLPEAGQEQPAPEWQFDAEPPEPEAAPERVESAGGAVLRGLDKLSGEVRDMELSVRESAMIGRLQVTLADCRYPADNPSGDAYAYLVIRENGSDEPVFMGWMFASSPALNALEHPRYDVWVMRCSS